MHMLYWCVYQVTHVRVYCNDRRHVIAFCAIVHLVLVKFLFVMVTLLMVLY